MHIASAAWLLDLLLFFYRNVFVALPQKNSPTAESTQRYQSKAGSSFSFLRHALRVSLQIFLMGGATLYVYKVSSFYSLQKLENKLRNKANRLTTGILLSEEHLCSSSPSGADAGALPVGTG